MVSAEGTSSRSYQSPPTAPPVASIEADCAVREATDGDGPARADEPSSRSAEQRANSNRAIKRRTLWWGLVRPTRRRFDGGSMVSLPTGAEDAHAQHHNSQTAEHA